MNRREFEKAATAASTNEQCAQIVADYFGSHPLHYGHGTDSAQGEADWLVCALLDWNDERWLGEPDPVVLECVVRIATQRVDTREPLAYLLNEAWFAGLKFYVERCVLVPRSPLAEVVENQFVPWCALDPGDRVLEVGTGSGCIAVAIAHYNDRIGVDATDLSRDALRLARRNAETHGVAERIRFFEADLFPSVAASYRVIISNPPYVAESRLAELPAEYGHEPVLALAGGNDGLGAVRGLLEGARSLLSPNGVLIVEVGESALAFETAFPNLPVVWIEFERGGSGVFVLTHDELEAAGF
jgi:ribosomal protein L3 glutamine methyltransferase